MPGRERVLPNGPASAWLTLGTRLLPRRAGRGPLVLGLLEATGAPWEEGRGPRALRDGVLL